MGKLSLLMLEAKARTSSSPIVLMQASEMLLSFDLVKMSTVWCKATQLLDVILCMSEASTPANSQKLET